MFLIFTVISSNLDDINIEYDKIKGINVIITAAIIIEFSKLNFFFHNILLYLLYAKITTFYILSGKLSF